MAGRAGEVDGEAAMANMLMARIMDEQVGPVGERLHPGGPAR
jgi:hypothetical protein